MCPCLLLVSSLRRGKNLTTVRRHMGVFALFSLLLPYVKERASSLLEDTVNKAVLPRTLSVYLRHSLRSQLEREVENNGFEPLTPCVQGRCSSQLS